MKKPLARKFSLTVVTALLLAVTACGASSSASAPPNPPPAGTQVTVSVTPGTASVDACRSVVFTASVTGTADGGVSWSVREGPSGGSITPAGTYTAPSTTGTYHVVATSTADVTASGEATVVVGPEKVLAIAVAPGSATIVAGGTVPFSATVTTTCGTFAAQ